MLLGSVEVLCVASVPTTKEFTKKYFLHKYLLILPKAKVPVLTIALTFFVN